MRTGNLVRVGSSVSPYKYTMPNEVCFARGNNYIAISPTGIVSDSVRTLKVYKDDAKEPAVVLTRKMNAYKNWVFPLDGVLSGLFEQADPWRTASDDKVINPSALSCEARFEFAAADGSDVYNLPPLGVINGAGREMESAMADHNYPNPNPQKIIFYPDFFVAIGFPDGQAISFNTGTTETLPDLYMSAVFIESDPRQPARGQNTTYLGDVAGKAFMAFDFSAVSYWTDMTLVSVGLHSDLTTIALLNTMAEVDHCTEGFFTRWIDRYGLLRYYRWSVEVETESTEVESTYQMLDRYLVPSDYASHSRRKTFTLHSRLVDQATFDLCKTIIDGRNIEYYDSESGQWRACYIDDAEIDDNGKRLKDMVVEIYTKELTI